MSARMEEEATVWSVIFESIASRRHPTAAISYNMRSVASIVGRSAGEGAGHGGAICAAMVFGCAMASDNSSSRECLPEDFPFGIFPKVAKTLEMKYLVVTCVSDPVPASRSL
ncbi:hypothetical protein NDU88_003626 [Pleurodeles waltl]|uniref:Uncharacterized protein n=1 Tax=Pleurodeles waltl TaxID=8319 RepID=A0AAV7V0J2_PLEWA|nr:hypothetical protein NDU88_003626 [Pleurodeles waltl]